MRKHVVVIGVLSGFLGSLLLGGTYALATNINFVLGSTNNQPDALTAVTAKNVDGQGGLNGPMIRLTNNSTASNATALALGVNKNRAPFTTSSGVKVTNLNSDKLDGIDSSGFMQGGGRLLTAHAQVVPGDNGTVLTSAVPAFSIGFSQCPADLSGGPFLSFANGGVPAAVGFELQNNNEAPAVGETQKPAYGAFDWPGRAHGQVATFDATWTDGHTATIRLVTYNSDGNADPRDNGCFAIATAIVK